MCNFKSAIVLRDEREKVLKAAKILKDNRT